MMKSALWILAGLMVVSASLAWVVPIADIGAEGTKPMSIRGISLEAPPQWVGPEVLEPLQQLHANWVAVIPFGFSRGNTPQVYYNGNQWWGERLDGAAAQIDYAHQKGMKVLLKPHVWIGGQGWPGDYELSSEAGWQAWEQSYRAYILASAEIAQQHQAELFCVGTEYRIAVRKRPEFWVELIKQVRAIYDGPLTYAANWDNYQNVTFWKELDYIGVDAYFPVCDLKTPQVETVKAGWEPWVAELSNAAAEADRPILFTEFGYRSVDYAAAGHWNVADKETDVNLSAQSNAYEGMFQALSEEDWFAGGFLWKWHISGRRNGGPQDDRYTPQNKPVEEVIKKWYKADR